MTPRTEMALVLALALMLGVLFLPGAAPPHGRWSEAGWDALHFPGFILITLALERLLSRVKPARGPRLAAAAGLAALVAALSELSHDWLGRSSSWGDFAADLAGIAWATAALAIWRPGGWLAKGVLVAAGLGVLVWMMAPAWRGELAAREQKALFPDLGGFDRRSSLLLWRPQGHASVEMEPGRPALRVEVGPGLYSGVNYRPAAEDWSGRAVLRLDISNPGEPFTLGIRVDDDRSDSSLHGSRYNGETEIPRGVATWRLPLDEIASGPEGRALDLTRIRRLILFTGEEAAGRVFLVESAVLE